MRRLKIWLQFVLKRLGRLEFGLARGYHQVMQWSFESRGAGSCVTHPWEFQYHADASCVRLVRAYVFGEVYEFALR